MRKFVRHPDAGSVIMGSGFTVASMGLSAYCGWNIAAGSHMVMQAISAILFSLVAFGLAVYIVRRERYRLSRDKSAYDGARRIVWFLLIANLLTDYSASAALRNLTNTKADNTNTIARNARSEVDRLTKKIAKRKKDQAWLRTDLEAPAAYDAKIFAQKQITERGRNIWQRSKQCTNTTVASSQAVCSKIASLQAEKAMAVNRVGILAEITSLEQQLVSAKKDVKVNKLSSNAALAPIIQLVNMATLSLDNDKSEIQWGQNFFVLFFTIIITVAIYFSSADIGRRLGPMPDPVPFEDKPKEPDNWWLPPPEPEPGTHLRKDMLPPEPISLHAETAPSSPPTSGPGSPEWGKQSMEALDKIVARVKARQAANA